MSELSGIAREIEEVIGTETTLRLLAKRGGTEIVVPAKAKNSVLSGLVGEPAAQKIIDAFGSGPMLLPAGEMRGMRGRRRLGKELLRSGRSVQDVALDVGCHIRTVEMWRRDLVERGLVSRGPGQQLQLPFN